jgi:hypothetical protein
MDKITNLWVILDEVKLEVHKNHKGETMKFNTEKEADEFASKSLHLWIVVKIHFEDRWVQHFITK